MAEAGLAPVQILRSATGVAAAVPRQGRHRRRWSRAAGRISWSLRADPLEDVRNLREIVGVWVGGVEVGRGDSL